MVDSSSIDYRVVVGVNSNVEVVILGDRIELSVPTIEGLGILRIHVIYCMVSQLVTRLTLPMPVNLVLNKLM